MSKILLIIPPVTIHSERDIAFKESLPHIGLCYVAGYIKSKGFQVEIIDSVVEKLSLRNIIDRIKTSIPHIIGITASTYQIFEAAATAKALKKLKPDSVVILGGYHATGVPKETLEKFEGFNFVVFGEGEITALNLINTLINNQNPAKVNGVFYREKNSIVGTPPQSMLTNLDILPFPAFELLPIEKYKGIYSIFSNRERALSICTARGCPYNCNFCFKSTGSIYRKRSINNVIEEIKRDIAEFGITQLIFTDETFSLEKERTLVLCETMIETGISKKIKWICQNRVDCVTPQLLKKMKEANCSVISYGVESGNQEILNKIKKGFILEQAVNAIKWTKEAGIFADTNFIIGHSYETKETIKDTINFSLKLDPDGASFSIMSPFPGTEIEKMAEKGIGGFRLLTKDWSKYGKQIGSALELADVSRTELERFHRLAYIKFFLRPSKFFNLLKVVNTKAIPIYIIHNMKRRYLHRIPNE